MIGSRAIGGVPQLPQKVSDCSAHQILMISLLPPARNEHDFPLGCSWGDHLKEQSTEGIIIVECLQVVTKSWGCTGVPSAPVLQASQKQQEMLL